jgi:gliding motility-associated lipoprotein GldH
MKPFSDFFFLNRLLNYCRPRTLHLWVLVTAGILSCDSSRIYEQNIDFEGRYWITGQKPEFEFQIDETSAGYNLLANVRNETVYPNANLYFAYYLSDSTGRVLEQKLVSEFLFDRKSGKPFGNSVLGDIYDHRFLLLENYRFAQPGKYTVRYEQSMRADTLRGVLAVGLRVERHLPG